jgi:hypothetical protein
MNLYQKIKDIFIQRRTAHGKFEEYALIVEPDSVVATNDCNDLIMIPLSKLTPPESYFLKNEVSSSITINVNDSIFNPTDLLITTSGIFILEGNSNYYVLGDLINSGSMIVDGTLKIGGNFFNYGSVVGSGIIE